MISVLIPVYNYNVVALVTQIHKQLLLCNVPFEILCLDDASTTNAVLENDNISILDYTSYLKSSKNLGRTNARQYLAETAKYEWVIFLDADVIPKTESFISKYLKFINKDYDAIYGGICYHSKKPDAQLMLRWVYGKAKEEVSASNRNNNVYKSIVSANFMIKKSVFLGINSQIEQKGYGFDNFFAALLKMNRINVYHIDNEVYHLGIETSKAYLKKKEKAAETLLSLHHTNKIEHHQNDLLRAFITLKRYGLHHLFSMCYKLFGKSLQHNLYGNNPSIKLLQLYRISYMCYKDLRTK